MCIDNNPGAELDAIAQAMRDNDRETYIHFDTGAAGRDLCPTHGKELDAFGGCIGCEFE